MERLKVLITVKTYPIPSSKYDELACTAGVRHDGSFIRLYPINFRDLPLRQQYRKYQWISVKASKHKGRDNRKESYRPDSSTIETLGEPISAKDHWSERAKFVLAQKSDSMEHLREQQRADRTSLGIFKPKRINDFAISRVDAHWKASFLAPLKQARLWETRKKTKEPPPKVPFKFQYLFECDDRRCKGHRMMIEDWEVGALYWRLIGNGATPDEAAADIRTKFFEQICASDRNTHFYVGTILAHQHSWVVIGLFWPKVRIASKADDSQGLLFK